MAFSMADSLSVGVADYTATELDIDPRDVLVSNPSKNQQLLWNDAEEPLVINIEDDVTFMVELVFDYITAADAETLMDFWTSKTKANGMENTFYWVHPTDGETYVSRFMSDPSHRKYNGVTTHEGVLRITLFINAVKA